MWVFGFKLWAGISFDASQIYPPNYLAHLSFSVYFWSCYLVTIFLPSLSSLQTHPVPLSFLSFKFMASIFIYCYCMEICICTCINVTKYNLLSFCKYVFKVYSLTLHLSFMMFCLIAPSTWNHIYCRWKFFPHFNCFFFNVLTWKNKKNGAISRSLISHSLETRNL